MILKMSHLDGLRIKAHGMEMAAKLCGVIKNVNGRGQDHGWESD